jgi:tetratricopeptide (TPR) repeat protein
MHRLLLWLILAANLLGAEANDPAELLKQAQAAQRKGDYDAAIAGYERALQMDLSDETEAIVWINLGGSYKGKHQWDKAIEAAEKAKALQPENGDSRYIIAQAQFGKGMVDESIRSLTEAIRLKPKEALFYNERSISYLRARKYDEALRDSNEAVRLDPEKVAYFAQRGAVRYVRNDFKEAQEDYTEAIRLDPSHVDTLNNRAILFHTLREWNKAVADLDRAISLKPDDADLWSNRADCHADLGNWEKAVADFQRAIELNPKDPESWMGLALIFGSCPDDGIRNGKRAMETATKACELTDWKVAKYLDALAVAQAESGNFDEAVALVDKTLQLDKADEIGLRRRRDLYARKQPYRSTVTSDLEAVARKSDAAISWLVAAQAALDQGSLDRASEMFRKALQSNPDTRQSASANSGLGSIRMRRGDFDGAITACTEAIRLEPEESLHYRSRANAYKGKGERAKAQADLDAAARIDAKKP